MKTKYGKIYVQERELSGGGIQVIVPKLLENVRFSNPDHKWYDLDGNLCPLYEIHKGKSISVSFKFDQEDKNGERIKFEAQIPLPFKLGQLAHQDFESVPKAAQEMLDHWKKIGMLPNNDNDSCSFLRDIYCAAFIVSLSPGCKLADMKSLHTSCDPWFLLDEYMEKAELQKELTFKQVHLYMTLFSEILEGKVVANEENLPKELAEVLIGVKCFQRVIAEKTEFSQPLIQAYRGFHDAIALETCEEWKQKEGDSNSILSKVLLKELRIRATGSEATVEMLLFDKDIWIEPKVRESFLFMTLKRTFGQHSVLVNDIMSLKKELAAGETSNSIIYSHCKEGMPLQDAVERAIDEIGALTQLMNETGELFINLFGETVEAEKVVETLKGGMYGHIQWCAISGRYNPDMIYDCVVSLE